MRPILQVTPYYPPHLGGLERVVEHLSTQLAQRRQVRVVTTTLGARGQETGTGRLSVRRHRAVELAHTPISPGLVWSLLRGPRTAVVHLHCAHALWPELAALAARLRRRPFVLHFHLDVDASGPLGRLLPVYKKYILGRVMRAADGVIALTERQAEFVRTTYQVSTDRVFVVPNGVGSEFFMSVRRQAPSPLRLLFVGRLSAQKNVGRLLEAMSLLTQPVRLRIVGDGELRTQLEAQAEQLGLDTVEFAGALLGTDLIRAYAEADAFVLPSDKEGMPLAALEAMAAALPLVATDVPGSAELLQEIGLLAAPDPKALAAAIDTLAGDPELRLRMARRSAEAARAYSWEAVSAEVERVYAEVAP